MAGMTPEQRDRFAEVRCPQGHRFDGFNYPTPEGICPFCVFPEFRLETAYKKMVAQLPADAEEAHGVLHPSLNNGR